MAPLTAGALRERIQVEQFVGGSWSVFATLSASVLPGGTFYVRPIIPEFTPPPTVAYQIRVRYREDLDASFRVRWGQRLLGIHPPVDPDGHHHELMIQAGILPLASDYYSAAVAQIASEGEPVSFTKDDYATGFDSATDTPPSPPAPSPIIAGFAKRVFGGNPQQYRDASLVEIASPRFLFVPSTIGTLPDQGAIGTLGGDVIVVGSVEPISVEGIAIAARIEVER
jgi:hypothetical protein